MLLFYYFNFLFISFLRYYALEVAYFKSSLDRKLLELLWNKYWVNTLSSSSLLTVRQVTNISFFFIMLYFYIDCCDCWCTVDRSVGVP